MWYFIAASNEYLVVTGAGISDVKIVKKAFVWPWQKVARISISPFDFSLSLQAMTIEKLQFSLPAVFTIGPDDHLPALAKYAKLLAGDQQDSHHSSSSTIPSTTNSGRHHVQDIVKGIIEGETRVLVSGMSMEEVFKERQVFKQKILTNVQSELEQFGLRIYNANVKELQDTPGSEYFAFLSRKAHEGASNQAKIDVAEARMRGAIGESAKQGRTKQELSKIDAETAVLETQRKSEKATADAQLVQTQTQLDMEIDLGKIAARRQAEQRDVELHRDVELKRAQMELERLRATDVTRSIIERESRAQAADAASYASLKEADSAAYASRAAAEARFYQLTKDAEAAFFAKEKEAAGLREMADAYAALADVLGGPQGLLQYLHLGKGTYGELAKANAEALRGLQPKISVWNTGSGSGSGEGGEADPMAPIRGLMRGLPPLLETINEQTGIQPPGWLARMPPQTQMQQQQQDGPEVGVGKGHTVNGVKAGET